MIENSGKLFSHIRTFTISGVVSKQYKKTITIIDGKIYNTVYLREPTTTYLIGTTVFVEGELYNDILIARTIKAFEPTGEEIRLKKTRLDNKRKVEYEKSKSRPNDED